MSCPTCERIKVKVKAEITRLSALPYESDNKRWQADALAKWINSQHNRDGVDTSDLHTIAELV